MTTLSIVIPAYNEEDGIAQIIERVLPVRKDLSEVGVEEMELIVVDDGSHDRTAEIAARYPEVLLVRHIKNQGYGAALKTGFGQASGDLLGFLDADGTYPPERFPELCQVALHDDVDLVVGSRMSGAESEMPPVRRIGNWVFANLVSLLGNHRVHAPVSAARWAELHARDEHPGTARAGEVVRGADSLQGAGGALEAECGAGRDALSGDDPLDRAHL